jgi:hypothetical protein
VKVPFSRTFKKIPELGVKKTFYLFLVVTLRFISRLFKRFPKGIATVELHNGNKMLLQPKKE